MLTIKQEDNYFVIYKDGVKLFKVSSQVNTLENVKAKFGIK